MVSAIEFDETGDLIAVGDRGGRIVLFEREKVVIFLILISTLFRSSRMERRLGAVTIIARQQFRDRKNTAFIPSFRAMSQNLII
jgi:hypothetical protein